MNLYTPTHTYPLLALECKVLWLNLCSDLYLIRIKSVTAKCTWTHKEIVLVTEVSSSHTG